MLCPINLAFKNNTSKQFIDDTYNDNHLFNYPISNTTILNTPINTSVNNPIYKQWDNTKPLLHSSTSENINCPYCKNKGNKSTTDTLDLLAITTLSLIIYTVISK